MLSDRALCFASFWLIAQAFVLIVCDLLLKFDESVMFWNILIQSHRLFYTHITRKMRYHERHTIPSKVSEVSLH